MNININTAIDIVEQLILQAIESSASDIHLEPQNQELRVRFRIDGILYNQTLIPEEFSSRVISRIKILAQLNVAEYRIPQDGKILFKTLQDHIDLRVSTFPCINGEKIVIRLLDKFNKHLDINALGLSCHIINEVKNIAQLSSGFFLVTGPTGSGKTTTLHSMINLINKNEKNICTLEDPVEYYIPGINQSNIYTEIGFTFETGIKALLRQDPDIIMVGEIRDKATAQVAIQAALTGHLVLSTLHTNDSVQAVMRLLDMKIEPFLINSALTGVLAQRLIRKLCNSCKYQRQLTQDEKDIIKKLNINIDNAYFKSGCANCINIGYKGRIGIFELLFITPELKQLITKNPLAQEIYKQAHQESLIPFRLDIKQKIEAGITDIYEIARILS
ncbi:GspE/PulE family protein [Candidatus Babela massiliensis]|uniref:Type II secretory pathway ATPase PulE/Tfp n=1 Tax=Candidatus Babela massiliensis TaxID=673862 RepID=V6DJK3_9BACT|nr:GspE/PulE family protein [Candidatus Babela massiliensis]CDK31068.1 Type II secretory pathway ATPase PulE/Tfp [Candidatus Babela massiliensis]